MDTILGSNEHFLLGRQWLNTAKSILGAIDEDKIQYEYNARNQITLWGPEENIRRSVIDYAGDTNETKFTYYSNRLLDGQKCLTKMSSAL